MVNKCSVYGCFTNFDGYKGPVYWVEQFE